MKRPRRTALPLLALALLALAAAIPIFASARGGGIVLGSKDYALHGTGFGTKRPNAIFNGGDPSGSVARIHWKSWGGKVAIGHGYEPLFKPSGGYYSKPGKVRLRASNLGSCEGHLAYRRLQVRVPKHPGGPLVHTYDWGGNGGDICGAPN